MPFSQPLLPHFFTGCPHNTILSSYCKRNLQIPEKSWCLSPWLLWILFPLPKISLFSLPLFSSILLLFILQNPDQISPTPGSLFKPLSTSCHTSPTPVPSAFAWQSPCHTQVCLSPHLDCKPSKGGDHVFFNFLFQVLKQYLAHRWLIEDHSFNEQCTHDETGNRRWFPGFISKCASPASYSSSRNLFVLCFKIILMPHYLVTNYCRWSSTLRTLWKGEA